MAIAPFKLANGKVVRRAIIYIRVSTAREDMKSPEQQLAICMAYCLMKGIEIVGEPVQDLDLSGSEFAKRKIGDIISRVRRKEADAIVVWEYSRFGRTLVGSLFYIKELESAGGDLLSATQDIDATTAAGRYMRDQFLRLAEYQLDMIRDGWKSTHKRRIELGLPHGGQPRFGYMRCEGCYKNEETDRGYQCTKKCGGLLVPDRVLRGKELEAAYLRFVDGASYYRVATDAWTRGVTSLRGNRMDEGAWRAVMDSGFAAGLLRSRTDKSERASNTRPDTYDIWADGAQEALISQATWDAYVERRLRQAETSTRDSQPKFALTGIMRCGETIHDGTPCGMRMSVSGQTRKGAERVRSFTCKHSERHVSGKSVNIAMHRVEAMVLAWLQEMSRGEENLAQVSMDRAAKAKESLSEIPAAERAVASLEARKKRINEGYEAGLTTLDEAKTRMESANTELMEAKKTLRLLQAQAAANSAPAQEVFQGLLAVWGRATAEEKRKALKKVVDHVRVTGPKGSDMAGSDAVVIPLWADASLLMGDKRRKAAA